ncbi:MAG TPA: hypothetical protein VFA33_19410 [Bryobacteraceae bacterium]|nr:hypothetical protein [Bryobacteraceae bacterium]
MQGIRPLDTQVLSQDGCYRRERSWYTGGHPELLQRYHGSIVQGWTGTETVVTRDLIIPVVTFEMESAQ